MTETNSNQPNLPSNEALLSQVIDKIRAEPLLFIIAIGILIVMLVTAWGDLGPKEFQQVLIVLAILAVVGILPYYYLKVRAANARAKAAERTIQEADINNGAVVNGALQEKAGDVDKQLFKASGKGTRVTDFIQSAGMQPKEEKNPPVEDKREPSTPSDE